MRNRVYIEITNRCNLACDFCHGTKRPLGTMPPEDFRRIAEKLRGETSYLYLHVLGEPLLHPQLKELLAIAGELGFRVCLVTNGTLLHKRREELLAAKSLHKVSVSLHSFEGNGGAGDLPAYLQQVWEVCLPLSERGVLCALRLWNEGTAPRLNGAVEAFLSQRIGRDVESLPRDARETGHCGPICFWSGRSGLAGRISMRRRAEPTSATDLPGSLRCCGMGR